MAPKKAAVPKKTVEEVNAEYSAKEEASRARLAVLREQLTLAKSQCDQARLSLVGYRDNRVHYDAKVAAENTSNESFEQEANEELESIKNRLKQLKRASKDKGYEISYVREVAVSVEREVAALQGSLLQIEEDARTDPRVLELELDRLASTVAGLESERPRLDRTAVALSAAQDRLAHITPTCSLSNVDCPLQLTIIGSSGVGSAFTGDSVRHCFEPPQGNFVFSPREVLHRFEHAMTQVGSFEVIEKIVPDTTVVTQQLASLRSESNLRFRLERALVQASSGPSSLQQCDDLVVSMIVFHCPCLRLKKVLLPDGTVSPQEEMTLLVSQLSDESKQFLRSTPEGHKLDVDSIHQIEVPLSTIVSCAISTSKRSHVVLIIDAWPAPKQVEDGVHSHEGLEDHLPSHGFCLFWSKECMETPLVWEYRHVLDSSVVSRRHLESTNLSSCLVFPRGCLLEVLTTIVQCTGNAQLLDAVTVARSLELMVEGRFGDCLVKLSSLTGTVFAPLALNVSRSKHVHHSQPILLRPLSEVDALHFEGRTLVNNDFSKWEHSVPLDKEAKWRKRPATSLFASRLSEHHQDATLIRHYAEETTGVPHTRWLLDVAIEDPQYHHYDEDVEDFDAERTLRNEEGADLSATSARVVRKRTKKFYTDEEEWSGLINRRLRQAMINEDELQRKVIDMQTNSNAVFQVLPRPLSAPLAESEGSHNNTQSNRTLEFSGSVPSMGGSMVAPPCAFDVQCAPFSLESPNSPLAHVFDPTEWYLCGKRCPERTVHVDLQLLLDCKHNESAKAENHFSHVTQAKDPLCHSVKRRLELLCQRLDDERPEGMLVQVAFHVIVVRNGGPKDASHLSGSIAMSAILTEQCIREQGMPCATLRAQKWLRATLTALLRRWETVPGKEWIPCAEMTLATRGTETSAVTATEESVFRVVRLFHVLRNWECGIRIHASDHNSNAQHDGMLMHHYERHVAWAEHLLRSVVAHGGALGTRAVSKTGPCCRIMSLKALPRFVGLQRYSRFRGVPCVGDDILGPQSSLNELSETEVAVAIDFLRRGIAELPMTAAVPLQTSLTNSVLRHTDTSTKPSSCGIPVVLLCWLVPSSLRNPVQPSSIGPSVSHQSNPSASEVRYLVQSLIRQYHHQERLDATEERRRHHIVCTSYEYEPLQLTDTEDALTRFSERHVADIERYFFTVQANVNTSIDGGEGAVFGTPVRGLQLPLGELGINRDEDTGDTSSSTKKLLTATPRDREHEGGHFQEHLRDITVDATNLHGQHAEVAVGNTGVVNDDDDDPSEYDETFRTLSGACLYGQPILAASPHQSLFTLPRRFWTEILRQTKASSLTRLSGSAPHTTVASLIKLVCVVWRDNTQPDVVSLDETFDLSSAVHDDSSIGYRGVCPEDGAIRSKIVELFLQRIMENRRSGKGDAGLSSRHQ